MKKTKLWLALFASSATMIVIPIAVVACGSTTNLTSTSSTNNVDLSTIAKNLEAKPFTAQVNGTYSTPEQIYTALNSNKNIVLSDLIPYFGTGTTEQITKILNGVNAVYTLTQPTDTNISNGSINISILLSTPNLTSSTSANITINGLASPTTIAAQARNMKILDQLVQSLTPPFSALIYGTNVSQTINDLKAKGFNNLTLNDFTKYINSTYLYQIQQTMVAQMGGDKNILSNTLLKGSYSISNVAASSDGAGINIFLNIKFETGAEQATKDNVQISFILPNLNQIATILKNQTYTIPQSDNILYNPTQVYNALNGKDITIADLTKNLGATVTNQITTILTGFAATFSIIQPTHDDSLAGNIQLKIALSSTISTTITITGLLLLPSLSQNTSSLNAIKYNVEHTTWDGLSNDANIANIVTKLKENNNLTIENLSPYVNLAKLQLLQQIINIAYSVGHSSTPELSNSNNLPNGSYSMSDVAQTSDGNGISINLTFIIGTGAQQYTLTFPIIFTKVKAA